MAADDKACRIRADSCLDPELFFETVQLHHVRSDLSHSETPASCREAFSDLPSLQLDPEKMQIREGSCFL